MLHIHVSHGIQRKDTRIGFVADYCAICREVRAFSLVKVGLAEHIQGFSPGQGETIGFLEVCRICGIVMQGDLSKYAKTSPKFVSDINELIRTTYPNVATIHAERLEIEGRIRTSPRTLSPSLRASLIREPFVLIAFHARYGLRQTSNRPALGLLAAFVLPFIVLFATIPIPKISTILFIATFVGCIAYALWSGVDDVLLKNWRKPRELLTRSLGPLNVTKDEIAAALKELTVRDFAVWKRTRPEKIIYWLASAERQALKRSAMKNARSASV